MPELPEVETVCRGIAPHLVQRRVTQIKFYNRRLRWPVATCLPTAMGNCLIQQVERRGKYLLLNTTTGTLILHLGMSGSLRIEQAPITLRRHDHVVFCFTGNKIVYFNDPRRFGSIHFTRRSALQHRLLRLLGPEPLTDHFNVDDLYWPSRVRQIAIKQLIMDQTVVAGIGNIYACESLYQAGIDPRRSACDITQAEYSQLLMAIQRVLKMAIQAGGSSLNDFRKPNGRLGYFQHQFRVYQQAGQSCHQCGVPIKKITQANRATFYCPCCQN